MPLSRVLPAGRCVGRLATDDWRRTRRAHRRPLSAILRRCSRASRRTTAARAHTACRGAEPTTRDCSGSRHPGPPRSGWPADCGCHVPFLSGDAPTAVEFKRMASRLRMPCPRPRRGVFQRTWLRSPQVSGGSARGRRQCRAVPATMARIWRRPAVSLRLPPPRRPPPRPAQAGRGSMTGLWGSFRTWASRRRKPNRPGNSHRAVSRAILPG